jgi:hypothetical protein
VQTHLYFRGGRGKTSVVVGVANVGDSMARDPFDFLRRNYRLAAHLTSHADVILGDERFTCDAGLGILRQVGIQDGVADTIGDFIRMTFTYRFARQ